MVTMFDCGGIEKKHLGKRRRCYTLDGALEFLLCAYMMIRNVIIVNERMNVLRNIGDDMLTFSNVRLEKCNPTVEK